MKSASVALFRHSRGVTLVELLSVLLITSLVVMAGVPWLSSYRQHQQAQGSAHEILRAMERARLEAINRNTTVRVSLVTSDRDDCELASAGRYVLVSRATPAGKCGAEPEVAEPYIVNGGMIDTVALKTSLAARGRDGSAQNTVAFNGLGRVDMAGDWIHEIDVRSPPSSQNPLRVTISPSGAIRMCDPAAKTGDVRACQA